MSTLHRHYYVNVDCNQIGNLVGQVPYIENTGELFTDLHAFHHKLCSSKKGSDYIDLIEKTKTVKVCGGTIGMTNFCPRVKIRSILKKDILTKYDPKLPLPLGGPIHVSWISGRFEALLFDASCDYGSGSAESADGNGSFGIPPVGPGLGAGSIDLSRSGDYGIIQTITITLGNGSTKSETFVGQIFIVPDGSGNLFPIVLLPGGGNGLNTIADPPYYNCDDVIEQTWAGIQGGEAHV